MRSLAALRSHAFCPTSNYESHRWPNRLHHLPAEVGEVRCVAGQVHAGS